MTTQPQTSAESPVQPALAQDPAAPKRRGRPPGAVTATFATDLQRLTIEDFSFVRGVLNNMTPKEAFLQFYANIHFDQQGRPIVPHGKSINDHFEKLYARIIEVAEASGRAEINRSADILKAETPEVDNLEGANQRAVMGFEQWAETVVDVFSENELPERYQEYLEGQTEQDTEQIAVISRSVVIQNKIKAVNYLQTLLAARPLPDSSLNIWFSKPVADAFADLKLDTLGALMRYIAHTGKNWHRGIKRLGPHRAQRIMQWLDDQQETLGPLQRTGIQWQPQQLKTSRLTPLVSRPAPSPALAGASPQRPPLDLARPFELIEVPAGLSVGQFYNPGSNLLGVRDDYSAIKVWLKTFNDAGKLRTFESYRREIERFYGWCLHERKVALSGVDLGVALEYQRFLKAIPPRYISTAVVTREDPRWRPFRGQLEPKSQTYALTVISLCFNFLWKNAYLSGNPFASVKSEAIASRKLDVTRSLSDQDLQWLKSDLDALPCPADDLSLGAMLNRRTKLIFTLALSTGLRLNEIATGTLEDLRRARVRGSEQDDVWMLKVVGKGKRERELPIEGHLLDLIHAHHRDVEYALTVAQEKNESQLRRIERLKKAQPLVCVIMSSVRRDKAPSPAPATASLAADRRYVDDESILANDNMALSRNAIFRTLKSFIRRSTRAHLKQANKAVDAARKRLDKCGDGEREEAEKALSQALADVNVWTRRGEISTHWLRHTFASHVLRSNATDQGLKQAQQFLGHASISTTAEYTKQDESEKVATIRSIDPLGLKD